MISDNAHKGSLYTLFLHSPLSAFCFVTNIVDIPIHLWDKCLAYVDRFMTEASRLITRCRGVGEYLYFFAKLFSTILLFVTNKFKLSYYIFWGGHRKGSF